MGAQAESVSPPPSRIALTIEYDGSAFSGWQKQSSPTLPTVQGVLEQALSKIVDSSVTTVCAGRTDAGVHAGCQVVHFDTPIDRGRKAWVQGSNSLLPPTVRVRWAGTVSPEFHARFTARWRRYAYVLTRREVAPALLAGRVTHWPRPLDAAVMDRAAQQLLGEQDFSAFRAAGCQSRSPFRDVHQVGVSEQGEFLVFTIQANAFLQHMVRNIVGSLLQIGQGLREERWLSELIACGDRREAGMTAPPEGLYLTAIDYPARFGLPVCCQLPPFLASEQ